MGLQGHLASVHPAAPSHRAALQRPIPSAVPSTLWRHTFTLTHRGETLLNLGIHLLEHDSEYRKKPKGPWQSQS